MNIPYLDLKAQNSRFRSQIMRAIGEVLSSGTFCAGAAVDGFESAFAQACGTKHAVAVGSGTEALWFALLAHGVGHGDEVVTAAITGIPTIEAICLTGARPVFADADPRTYTINPEAFARIVSRRTKAVVPGHLFGQMAEMDAILEIANSHGIAVIEDAADALGADDLGRKAGSLGDCGCFNFYPSKSLGAIGHAGAVVTHDRHVADRIRMLCNHGRSHDNRHHHPGWTGKIDAIQAAVLIVKLKHLEHDNTRRRAHAATYHQALNGLSGVASPLVREGTRHAHHIHALRVRDRLRLLTLLDEYEIGYAIHHPVPTHLQPGYRFLGHKEGDFPVAEACAREFVSLPIDPQLDREQIDTIADVVREACGASVAA